MTKEEQILEAVDKFAGVNYDSDTETDFCHVVQEELTEFVEEIHKEKENVVYPQIIKTRPMCYEDGGTCTNPFHDCINCPKIFSSGGTNTTNFLDNI